MSKANRIWINRRKKVLAPTTISPDLPLVIERAKGVKVWDIDGKEYLDFVSQVSVCNIGHSHPKVVRAIAKQAEKLLFCISTDFDQKLQVRLAEELIKITPGKFPKKVLLDIGGAEANISAVELLLHARPERRIFWAFHGGFYGRKGHAKDFTCSKSVQKRGYRPTNQVYHFPYPDCAHCEFFNYFYQRNECQRVLYKSEDVGCIRFIKAHLGRDFELGEVNGIILELVQGEGGINVPNPDVIRHLVRFCKENNISVIVDEIQTGFGRCGRMFASEYFGIEPDIITLGKTLGSGLPISAMVYRESLIERKEEETLPIGWHSGTFSGSPLACAAALATLEVLKDKKLLKHAEIMGLYLEAKLVGLKAKYGLIKHVKGLGLMLGLEFTEPHYAHELVVGALKKGLILLGAGNPKTCPTVRLTPPLIVTKEEIDQAIEIIDNVLKEMK